MSKIKKRQVLLSESAEAGLERLAGHPVNTQAGLTAAVTHIVQILTLDCGISKLPKIINYPKRESK